MLSACSSDDGESPRPTVDASAPSDTSAPTSEAGVDAGADADADVDPLTAAERALARTLSPLGAVPPDPAIMNSTRLDLAHLVFAKYRTDYDALFTTDPLDPDLDPGAANAARFPASGKPAAGGAPAGAWEGMGRSGVREKERATILRSMQVEPLVDRVARLAGAAVGLVQGAGTIDAIVMATASLRGDAVYTSDPDVLEALRAAVPLFARVRVLRA